MLGSVLRRFFWRRPLPETTIDASWYAEAQLAGWVTPPAELRTQTTKVPAGAPDTEDLVGRFYVSQEC